MYYPEDVIEEVRNSSDIVEVIGEYVQLKKKGNSYFGLCPFHNEKTGSFSVSSDKQMFYCFGCGKGGSVFTFLMEHENYTYPEAIEHLAERAGIVLPKQEMTIEQKQEQDYRAALREMNRTAANYFYKLLKHEHGKRGYDYLRNRGLTDDTIIKFGLGYSDIYKDDLYHYLKKKGYTDYQLRESGLVEINDKGAYDKFWNRVMFPIVDMNGKVIGFGGRVMGDGEPKYLNSKETVLFEKKKNLYGLYQARRSKRSGFILCEGYMDVISMHQAGFDNAVASLGTAYTEEQARLIKRYRDHVYLAYDNDGAGIKAALRAIDICRNVGLSARVISMKPYKDPDEFIKNLGKEEYEKRIDKSVSAVMFELQVLSDKYNLSDPEGKTQFINEAAVKLSLIADKLERETYVEAAAREYSINERALKDKVNKTGAANMVRKQYKEIEESDKKLHQREKEKEKDGGLLQEKLLLTWIANEPSCREQVFKWVSPEDFSEGLTRKIAVLFDKQIKDKGDINPAEIVDSFKDVSVHSEVSAILNAEVYFDGEQENDAGIRNQMKSKAITETVLRVKEAGIDRRMKEIMDMSCSKEEQNTMFLKLMDEQALLKKLYITFGNG